MALREKQRREREAPLIYYRPHEGQQRAHKAVSENRITIVHPGNRWGKSHMNAAEIVAHMYGYRPWEVPGLQLDENGDYPHRNTVPNEYWIRRDDRVPLQLPNRHLCATGLPARQGILTTMWPKIEAFFPPAVRASSGFRVNRGAQSVPLVLTLPLDMNTMGGQIFFGSGEQDPMAYEGQDFGSASFDEPPKRSIWAPMWRGLTDRLGRVWMTATPIGPNAPWVFEQFVQKGDELEVTIAIIAGSIHDNPHVTDNAKRQFLQGGGFTAEEREARESGSWSFLTHRAFPQFDPAVHIVPAETPVPMNVVIGVACDPAHRRPFFFVWGAWTPGDELLIFDEWPHEDHSKMTTSPYTVPAYARIVRSMERRTPDYRCLDPRFGSASPTIKGERHTSIQEDFAKEGMHWDCRIEGTEREEIGMEKLRQMLSWDKEAPLSPTNRPSLRVRASCINTINALAYSSFAPSKMADKLDEKLAMKYKDARDALRYLVLYPWVPNSKPDHYSYVDEDTLLRENDENW